MMKKISSQQVHMGKLQHGADLLEEITQTCNRENIRLGRIQAIGAVQRARLAYYNQKTREYRFFTIDQPLEILNLSGNISLKDGEPMVHAHISLADDAGNAYGGHVAPGTVIFACEIVIESFEGPAFERSFDEETGLPLWRL
ncbi:MAG: DNA-binding protein [Desulfobacterales bacterium]|nr:DNA-binding protein [Desulfobacterales bacterium]MBS3754209.1 DNA-binding protein [Desulfobacterales bacterium]